MEVERSPRKSKKKSKRNKLLTTIMSNCKSSEKWSLIGKTWQTKGKAASIKTHLPPSIK